MSAQEWTVIFAGLFGTGGVVAAVTQGAKAYQANRDRDLETARKQARIELLQEQSSETIKILKEENLKLTEDNQRLWALIDVRTS